MSKQKSSFIPIAVIVLVILGIAYFMLGDEIALPKFGSGPTITRLDGFPTVIYTDKAMDKQRRVITNQEELNDFLNYVDDSGLLVLRDNVDFEKQILLGVSTETEQNIKHSMKVRRIYENKAQGTMLVSLLEEEPGESCEVEVDPNVSVDLVAITKTNLNIEFDRVKKVIECN